MAGGAAAVLNLYSRHFLKHLRFRGVSKFPFCLEKTRLPLERNRDQERD